MVHNLLDGLECWIDRPGDSFIDRDFRGKFQICSNYERTLDERDFILHGPHGLELDCRTKDPDLTLKDFSLGLDMPMKSAPFSDREMLVSLWVMSHAEDRVKDFIILIPEQDLLTSDRPRAMLIGRDKTNKKIAVNRLDEVHAYQILSTKKRQVA
jgi:hypothetical protein